MEDEAVMVIKGEYTTFKHIKTRKAVVLEVEVPEEHFQDVIAKLGMPIGGESKPVAVCLLQSANNAQSNCKETLDSSTTEESSTVSKKEQSEGDRMRVRAHCLCVEATFQKFARSYMSVRYKTTVDCTEFAATRFIYNECNITSRSELTTNEEAQALFKQLDQEYKDWQFEQRYPDNLNR